MQMIAILIRFDAGNCSLLACLNSLLLILERDEFKFVIFFSLSQIRPQRSKRSNFFLKCHHHGSSWVSLNFETFSAGESVVDKNSYAARFSISSPYWAFLIIDSPGSKLCLRSLVRLISETSVHAFVWISIHESENVQWFNSFLDGALHSRLSSQLDETVIQSSEHLVNFLSSWLRWS